MIYNACVCLSVREHVLVATDPTAVLLYYLQLTTTTTTTTAANRVAVRDVHCRKISDDNIYPQSVVIL